MEDNNERVIITKGEKVALVVPEKQDIEMWYRGINNPDINKYLLMGNSILPKEEEEKFYEKCNDKTRRTTCIMSLSSKKVIGNVALHDINYLDGHANVGIVIFDNREHSKGFGTESLKLILHYGFNKLNLRKIKIEYFSGNKPAGIVYNRVGFKEIGRHKEEYYVNGEYGDKVMMEIFKDEFYKINKNYF